MKIALLVGLLGLALCADNNINGPGNVVYHGKDNTIRGKLNSIDGFNNKVKGNKNKVKGDTNKVHGDNNFIDGDGNFVIGGGNSVVKVDDIESDENVQTKSSSA